ncbi:ATP-binding protein [Nocardia acidivorans]|uniref:ATP-binding protein n=1 Tax=Nocardia acidivorans TaxID=404580 RepID=UPI00082DF4E4|nr:sensor histidine kinase [Nocardia acidivorans]
MAVMFLWIVVPLLVVAVAAAGYAAVRVRAERKRADQLAAQVRGWEQLLEQLVRKTLPSVTESIRRPGMPITGTESPPGLEQSTIAPLVWQTVEYFAEDLRLLWAEASEQGKREVEAQARQAIAKAEQAVRDEAQAARDQAQGASRDVTGAAVRSFGTSVVSLGADVGKVVSAALREHRDDAVYETLIRIDHSVQQMIRQAQSYVIVSGGLPGRRWPQQSVTDVVGGAVGRVRDYLRVRTTQADRVVVSRVVEPLVHTVATLLDNALRYSPPTSFVDISFQEGHHGVTILIDDAGVRMNPEQLEDARQVLAGERAVDILELGPAPKIGFPSIAALVRRYGFSVYVDGPNAYGGVRAMVFIPESLLVAPQDVPEQPALATPVVVAPAQEPTTVEEEEIAAALTASGLTKRRRRTVVQPSGPTSAPMPALQAAPSLPQTLEPEPAPALQLARPDIAVAWYSGSVSGRVAAAETDQTEGKNS